MGGAGRPAPGSGGGRTLVPRPSEPHLFLQPPRRWGLGHACVSREGVGPPVQLQVSHLESKPQFAAVHANSSSVQTGAPAQHVRTRVPMFHSGGGCAGSLLAYCACAFSVGVCDLVSGRGGATLIACTAPPVPSGPRDPGCSGGDGRGGQVLSGPGTVVPSSSCLSLLSGPCPALVPLPCCSLLARAPPPRVGGLTGSSSSRFLRPQ